MMSLLGVVVRAAVTLGFLWLLARVVGKRGLGDVGPLDFVMAFVLGNLANGLITGQLSLPEGIVAMGMIMWLHLLAGSLLRRSAPLRRICDAEPLLLVRDGRLQPAALARASITQRECDTLLREAGAARLGDVHELRLEPDGTLSLLCRPQAQSITHADLAAVRNEP